MGELYDRVTCDQLKNSHCKKLYVQPYWHHIVPPIAQQDIINFHDLQAFETSINQKSYIHPEKSHNSSSLQVYKFRTEIEENDQQVYLTYP